MNIKSEKEFYGDELKRVALRFNADIFVWGEEMINKKLVLYPKKLKDIIGYEEVKENLEPCGIVLIDTRKQDFLHCTSAMVNVTNGNVYMSEAGFNSSWKILKNSVSKGIRIANETAGSLIENPDEIIVFDNLQRAGSTPVIVNDIIKYEARELTQEERYRDSRKQSLLDNPRMLYFYESSGRYYHDRDCAEVKQIAPERFAASEKIPDKEICPKCQRRIYIRKACYPNMKQIGICDKILRDHGVSLGRIKHCVMDIEMKFHATSMEEFWVEGAEDTWIVKGLCNNHLTLWHNNYVKTGPTERYITEGFHRQKVENKSLTQLLTYVESYSFVKHLEKEQQSVESEQQLVEMENQTIRASMEQEKVLQNNTLEHISITAVLRGVLDKVKRIFKI